MEGEVASNAEFVSKVAAMSNVEPAFPTDFLKDTKIAPTEGQATPTKLKLTFALPHQVLMSNAEVDLALLPAVSGDFGVMPGHVPTIAELRPGIVAVHKDLDKDVEKYFVSGGFAFAHADSSVEITAVEATKLEDLDPSVVKAGLAEYTARLASASGKNDDMEAAIAQIGIEVYSAMDAALQ
eukprot:jgi/Ulvmu1/1807/UM119_0025.1